MSKKLKFICPNCGGNKINRIIWESHTTEIKEINEDGICKYDKTVSEAEESNFQCADCSFEILDKYNYPIEREEQLAQWIKEHCSQK